MVASWADIDPRTFVPVSDRICEGPGCKYCAAMAEDGRGIEYHPQRPETIYEYSVRLLSLGHYGINSADDLANRDRAWVERELGDVEVVARVGRPVYDFSAAIRAAADIAAQDALTCGTGGSKVSEDGTVLPIDPYAMHIPVESLGREE